MSKIKPGKRYDVRPVDVKNIEPPPSTLVKYGVFDRRANMFVGQLYDSEAEADADCELLNELSLNP